MARAESLTTEMIECLITALLAANSYSLEKVWHLLPAFREAGLTLPSSVTSEDLGRLTVRLAKAGYDRGGLTSMFAERLQHLMHAIDSGDLNDLPDAVARDDSKLAEATLREVRGIGPQVAHNAWLLFRTGAKR